jgi:TolA-binding protein
MSKQKSNPVLFFVATSSILFLLCAAGDPQDDERYRQRYDLMDAEKSLLAQEDDTSRQIHQLNIEINEKQKKLQYAHMQLKNIRSQLISIQMKLLP